MTEQAFEVSRRSHSTVGGSRFPPIADYGFISDCEVCALVAPSGSVEWMCLPRMDGPSIFASMLDRHAGWFRLGPADVPGAVVALTGISHSQRVGEARLDALNTDLVLGNKVVFGTVNAARRHHDQAADALAAADPSWLARLIIRRLSAQDWPAVVEKRPEDIKIVVDMTQAA